MQTSYRGVETMQLILNQDKCDKCGECVEECMSNALNTPFTDNYPVWDKSKCSFCETCSDLCPTEAILCKWE